MHLRCRVVVYSAREQRATICAMRNGRGEPALVGGNGGIRILSSGHYRVWDSPSFRDPARGKNRKRTEGGNARFGRRRVVVAVDQGKPTATRDNEKRPRCFSLGTGLDSVAGKTSTARGEKKKPNFPISKAEGTHGWRRGEGKKGKGRKGE